MSQNLKKNLTFQKNQKFPKFPKKIQTKSKFFFFKYQKFQNFPKKTLALNFHVPLRGIKNVLFGSSNPSACCAHLAWLCFWPCFLFRYFLSFSLTEPDASWLEGPYLQISEQLFLRSLWRCPIWPTKSRIEVSLYTIAQWVRIDSKMS
jgi:hypothetical protein